MVRDVPTEGSVTPPTIAADAACSRVGCSRPATVIWQENTTGAAIAYCSEDSVEAYNLVTRWGKHPEQRVNLDRYAVAVEKASGRPLYGQPMFDRPGRESLS